MDLVFIRHGQTMGNQRGNYVGRTDEPLSINGLADLTARRDADFYPEADYLFCSPLLRCRQTAAIIYPLLKPLVVGELRECDFGEFEGRNYQDLNKEPAYQQWLASKGELPFPGGESREEFSRRCCQGFAIALADLPPQLLTGEATACAAFVVHGGTIMSLLAAYTDMAYYDAQCANGQGWRCRLEPELWQEQKRLSTPVPLGLVEKEEWY